MTFLTNIFNKVAKKTGDITPTPKGPSTQGSHTAVSLSEGAQASLAQCSTATQRFMARTQATVGTLFRPDILLAFDATGSRSSTWDYARKMQAEQVKFLTDSGEGAPMIRVSYFKGHSKFQATKWMDNVGRLQDWMAGIDCECGQTQITKIFQDAQKEIVKGIKIASITYIGDHCEEGPATLYSLADQIGSAHTPINFLHEVGNKEYLDCSERKAREIFQEIAGRTGGHYECFVPGNMREMRDLSKVLLAQAYGPQSRALAKLKADLSLSPSARRLALGS